METTGYQIAAYRRDHLDAVVALLAANLWGEHERSRAQFHWKYHENPHVDGPLGVVAIHEGSVVAFRGYFATVWFAGDADRRTVILVPGDTVVDPAHRRKGLSVSMGRFATERLASRSRVFLNLTAGKSSVPGYLRLGFVPLVAKRYLRRSSLAHDLGALCRAGLGKLGRGRPMPSCLENLEVGDHGDLIVSPGPRPEDMARLASIGPETPQKLALLQDAAFFRWRFASPINSYGFYFCREGQAITGYLVLLLSGGRQGTILDCAEASGGAIGRILDHIAASGHFTDVSVLDASLTDDVRTSFRRHGFKYWGLQQGARWLVSGEWPVLVRPTTRDCSEEDWFLWGLDVRNPENWALKEICGDAV